MIFLFSWLFSREETSHLCDSEHHNMHWTLRLSERFVWTHMLSLLPNGPSSRSWALELPERKNEKKRFYWILWDWQLVLLMSKKSSAHEIWMKCVLIIQVLFILISGDCESQCWAREREREGWGKGGSSTFKTPSQQTTTTTQRPERVTKAHNTDAGFALNTAVCCCVTCLDFKLLYSIYNSVYCMCSFNR